MKNIDGSMLFECDIADLKNPKIRGRELINTSIEIRDMMALSASPYIGDDTRKLLKRDFEPLKKKFEFIVNYPKKKEGAANE